MKRRIFKEVTTAVFNFLNFFCMVCILGIQTLLQGSWRVTDIKNTERENEQVYR